MFAYANVGKFHFTSSRARYFTMCDSTLFHVLRKQNISLYAFVSSNAVLVKKKVAVSNAKFETATKFDKGIVRFEEKSSRFMTRGV